MFKKRNKGIAFWIKIVVVLIIFVGLVVFTDNTIKDIVSPLALKDAEIIINSEVNRVVSELLESDEFANKNFIQTSDSSISFLTDSYLLNQFKAKAIIKIEDSLKNFANASARVQLGNVVNSSFLSNRGPNITILYDLCCSVNGEIISEFKSAGVNQTVHIIKLKVTTDAYVAVFWEQTHKTVETDYIISETVIMGEVPNFYGNIKNN